MPDETSPIHPIAPAAAAALNPERVIAAVAHPIRRAILRVLAGTGPLTVNQLAAAVYTQNTLVGKHLIILRKAGIVASIAPPDGDGRKSFYELPAHFRTRDAAGRTVLDFGAVVLRFA